MATLRDQRGANLNAAQQGLPSVQQAQTPFSLAGRDTRIDTFPTESIQRVLNMASQLAGRVTERANEEEYLKGANAAASGKAVEDLDSNWLTAQFQKAGYNDQYKRMQMAKVASDISANMPQYAKMSPDEFLKVVDEKTTGLFENTDGMTLNGRKALLENQLTFSNTLIRTQAAQHGKYLVEQRAAMYNSQGNTLVTLAAQAKATGDGGAYANATAATMAWAKSILADDKLPLETRRTQVTSMMGLMLQQDLRTPVETAVNSGLFNELPAEDLAKLQGQIRESKSRTEVQDNMGLLAQKGQLDARQAVFGDVTPEQYTQTLQQMVDNKLISAGGFSSAIESFYKDYAKQAKASQLGQAYATGNQTYMLQQGASEQDGADAFIKARMKQPGATASSVAFDLLQVGAQTGFPSAYKSAAKLIEPSLSNFGTVDEMNPDAAATVTGLIDRVTVAENQGDKTAWTKLLSGLSEENQEKMVYMREQIKAGRTIDQAGQGYIKQQQDYAGLTPAQKSQILTQRQSDVNTVVNSLEAQGFFSRTWQGLAGLFSDTQQNLFQARVASGDITAAQEMSEVAAAYREELQAVVLKNPNVTKDGMEALASAKLANRVLRVGETTFSPGSVLIAPRGQTVQSMLGLPADVAPDRIGRAIAALDQTKAPEGFESSYSFMPDGSLNVQFFNKQGDVSPNSVRILPQVVQERIREDDRAAATANNEVYGDGKLFVDKTSNVGIRVNGVNTAGVDEQRMLVARGKLIDFEGIRSTTYRDSTGVQTNGIGISDRSPYFAEGQASGMKGGTEWSPRTIHDTFVAHTNMVARQMPGTAAALGWSRDNDAQFQFMMQMGYQAGSSWYRTEGAYSKLADAIRVGDREKAVQALAATPAYKLSQDERKQYYVQTLLAGMQE